MSMFGTTIGDRPAKIEDLISGELMSRLDRLDVVSRKIFSGVIQGERRSKRRGISVEFDDYRHYVPGDDIRFIDWNIFARLDRLFLKLFIEEEDLSLVIGIDATGSMDWGNPGKFFFAQRLAMALGYIGLGNRNRVTLCAWNGGGLQSTNPLRGTRRTMEMGSWLLACEPGGDTSFADTMRAIATRRQGKGVMILLSDFLFREGYEEGLRYLAGGGYDTFCMQVLSPEETDPAAAGMSGDLLLQDIEDESVAEITVSGPLLRRYRERLDAWCESLHEYCTRQGMVHMRVDSGVDIEALLVETFRARGILR